MFDFGRHAAVHEPGTSELQRWVRCYVSESARESAAVMALSAGTRFGPYEIHSALGAGSMGAVYRARDTRLNRDVALKVLPGYYIADGDVNLGRSYHITPDGRRFVMIKDLRDAAQSASLSIILSWTQELKRLGR